MKNAIVFLLFFICSTRHQFNGRVCEGKKTRDIEKRSISIPIDKTTQLISFGKEIFLETFEIWNILLEEPNQGIPDVLTRERHHKVMKSLIDISSKLSILGQQVQNVGDYTTQTILRAFPKIIKLELALQELSNIVNYVNLLEEKFRHYLNDGHVTAISQREFARGQGEIQNMLYEKHTLLEFAIWAAKLDYNSIQSILNRLHELVVPNLNINNGILDLVRDASQEVHANICNLKVSPHQTLYNLYNAVALVELKGNMILQFSYMLLKLYNKGNFTVEAELAKQKYEERARQKENLARDILANADRSIYKCDPKQYVEGVTYTKLTKLLQGYIENEVNLNPYGTCSENCAFYEFAEVNGCFKNQFCSRQPPCQGKVLNCRYVDSDMNICRSSRTSERRYDWVEYENGKVLGSKGTCEKTNLFKVDSWWRYIFWHCSYCLCLCDDSHRSDRYFSMREATSDIEDNKVVTGVRMIKQNKIIHVQIQQGILLAGGVVDKLSLSWKPVDNFTVDDVNVEKNVDYHAMSWLERSVDTDEIFGPSEHVVTGVRLRKLGGHLNLEIRISPINFSTGIVSTIEHGYWMGNDNTDANYHNPRTEIKLTNPDIPIRNGPNSLNSKHDQYIQFQASSFETDAGQSTVPYIDTQALTSQASPISGLGFIHRGKPGSGGFLALKLISYDYTSHLSPQRTK